MVPYNYWMIYPILRINCVIIKNGKVTLTKLEDNVAYGDTAWENPVFGIFGKNVEACKKWFVFCLSQR